MGIHIKSPGDVNVGDDVWRTFEKNTSGGWYEVLGVRADDEDDHVDLWVYRDGFDESELVRLEVGDEVAV